MKKSALILIVLAALASSLRAELRPHPDCFPARLHATIYRNCCLAPDERLVAVLQMDSATVRRIGATVSRTPPAPPTPAEVRAQASPPRL